MAMSKNVAGATDDGSHGGIRVDKEQIAWAAGHPAACGSQNICDAGETTSTAV
jgi:hypothetical protein